MKRMVFSVHLGRREFLGALSGGILMLSYKNLRSQKTGRSEAILSKETQSKYPEPISVLQGAYREEIISVHSYSAYGPKALSEGYPRIAYLFRAYAVSESIHARNFRNLLSNLGLEAKESRKPEIKVAATKENLRNSTQMEVRHIDHFYPESVERGKSENHEGVIMNLKSAWETEKQHRDLLRQIQAGAGIFFGILSKKIESPPVY